MKEGAKDYPLVSIINLNYNGKKYINDCFNSLRKTNYPKNKIEIIMVDNGSTDDSVEYVQENFQEVEIISLEKNLGWAGGNNKGADKANGKYLVFLNNDTVVTPEWLKNLIKPMENDKTISAASSKLLFFDDPGKINSVGCFLTAFGLAGAIGKGEDKNNYEEPIDLLAPSGASMIIEKEFFEKIGMFDSDHFLYCEDTDIGWRMLNYGKKSVLAPDSIVYHKEHGSGLASHLYYYYMTRNRLWVILKNARTTDLIWMLPISVFSSILQGLIFLVKKHPRLAGSTFKGVTDAFLTEDFQKMIKKRSDTPKTKEPFKYILGFRSSIDILKDKIKEHLK